jgi:hypothetical protein
MAAFPHWNTAIRATKKFTAKNISREAAKKNDPLSRLRGKVGMGASGIRKNNLTAKNT